MSTTHGILIALSDKRLKLILEDPETLEDVVEARHEEKIPGLVDLGPDWEALDVLLSGRGRDALLGDAVVARSGDNLDVDTAFEAARVLVPGRVAEVGKKLADLPAGLIRERLSLLPKPPKAGTEDARIAQLEALLAQVVELYASATKSKQSLLAILV